MSLLFHLIKNLYFLNMNLKELSAHLEKLNVSPDQYYIHGLFGSPDDNEKLAMEVKKGRYFAEYEVYFKERGTKQSSKIFTSETEACEFMYSKLKDEHTYNRIQQISNLNAMTVNERLFASELTDEFDRSILKNKLRARQILRWLKVDEESINLILESDK